MNIIYGSRYLITALGGGVAFLCLALGLQLLSPELPDDVATWLEDGRIRNGLILALGGSMLSFLLGSGFVVAARKILESPRRRLKGGPHSLGRPPDNQLKEAGDRLSLAGQELSSLAENPGREPESLERLNIMVEHLRDTVRQTEAIVESINEVGGLQDKPNTDLE